jgi:hypothetical protein
MAALASQRLKGCRLWMWKAVAYCVRFEVREELVDGGMRVVANARSVSERCTIAVGSLQNLAEQVMDVGGSSNSCQHRLNV